MAEGGRAEGDGGLGRPLAGGEDVVLVSLLVGGEDGEEEVEERGGGGPVGWSGAGCTTVAMVDCCVQMYTVLVEMCGVR